MAWREDGACPGVRGCMKCRQCGATNRPGLAQCAYCGASLAAQDGAEQDRPRSPKQDRYIPGGASGGAGADGGAPSGGASAPAAPSADQLGPAAPRRPQGSLGRRLAQQSGPSGADEGYPPQRGSDAPRRAQDDAYPPRGNHGDNYPPRGSSRSQPDERRARTGGRPRGRDYDAEPEAEDGARYGADRRGARGYAEDSPGWADDRGRGPAGRRGGERDRGGPPLPPLAGESEEMIARREPPRSGSRRRGPPDDLPGWSDEYPNPIDDARGPQGMRGGADRRSSGPRSSPRRGGSADYVEDARRYDSPTGYTDEERAARFDESAVDSYSEEYEARPRYPEARRGSSSGSRGSGRSAPGGGRASGYRDDERGAYDGYDDYDQGAQGRSGQRSGREMGGYDARYPQVPSYEDVARGYPPVGRGGQIDYGQRGGFEQSSEWQPGGGYAGQGAPRGRASGGSRTTGKPRKSIMPMAFSLFVIVVVVVGLVAVIGPDLAPKLGKYLPFLGGGAQATPPPTFATYTPGPTPTLLPNTKLFTNTAAGFAMDYPTAWATSTTSGAQNDVIYQFAAPTGSPLALLERAPALDSQTDAQLLQAEVAGARAQGVTLTEITSAATTEGVGGEIWQRREYQATGKNGVKLHIAILACHHLGKGYVIALFGSDTGFATADTATFEPMLRSYRFL